MNKRTPLYDEHIRLRAVMTPFGGWDMPVYYSSVIDEHTATREHAGLFDTCHMGEIEVSGVKSAEFLQSILSNDLRKIEPGCCMYSALTNDRGGCVDDLYVYMFDTNIYILVVNASTSDKDFAWITTRPGAENVNIVNRSEATGMIALQGPAAIKILSSISQGEIPIRFRFRKMTIGGIPAVVSRTGYTGEDGVEIFHDAADSVQLWRKLLETGAPHGIKPVGLGARDTLRLEACYSLYGHELSDEITPVEAGISFAVGRTKKFPGKEVIMNQISDGPARRIVAFELLEKGVPRNDYKVFFGSEEIGYVTSGCHSPTLKKGIGLAMVKSQFASVGAEIKIEIRNKKYSGVITKRPFYTNVGGSKK